MKKKIGMVVLCLIMVLAMLPQAVMAEEVIAEDNPAEDVLIETAAEQTPAEEALIETASEGVQADEALLFEAGTGENMTEISGTVIAKRIGWQKIKGKWYYYNSKGVRQKGWQKISGKWYYLGKNGVMRTGWKKISGKKYYFGKNGVRRTGWQKISGKWYYFNKKGVLTNKPTGWVKAYRSFLLQHRKNNSAKDGYMSYSWYYLYDIDKDGTPEMIISEYLSPDQTHVYQYVSGEVKDLGVVGTYSYENMLYGLEKGEGMMVIWARQGMWDISFFTIKNHQIIKLSGGKSGTSLNEPYPFENAGFKDPKRYKLNNYKGLNWTSNPKYKNQAIFDKLFN